ncbi:MAG: ferrochelatase [Gammaproteobacteria bacterium]|nr:ferrochelatase [Gammaproteobacteria bacterium]MDH5344687.1 ferrochelatase [Gammaproteobacteria bacterium]
MPRYDAHPPYEHGLPESTGILLVNLGTPDAPTPSAVRRFLAEFLSDPRVVEIPRPLWLAILYGVILWTRPARSAKAYAKIWTEHGSPLLLHTNDIAAGVREKLAARLSGAVHVEVAMSYGSPSIEAALESFYLACVRRIVVLPLYPQYSGTTTASVFDAVTRLLSRRRWVPELRFINHYHDAPGYIAALAASVRDHWDLYGRGERLLMSFHGVPKRTLDAGDPYHCQCQKTARLLAAALELGDGEWTVSFQSRLGRAEWLRPYTNVTLEAWGRERAGLVDVVCPGFAADCLETLEEIAMENAASFRAAGGGDLRYIPALNARDDHVSFLARIAEKNVSGWPESDPDWSLTEEARRLEKSRQRAIDMGAKC